MQETAGKGTTDGSSGIGAEEGAVLVFGGFVHILPRRLRISNGTPHAPRSKDTTRVLYVSPFAQLEAARPSAKASLASIHPRVLLCIARADGSPARGLVPQLPRRSWHARSRLEVVRRPGDYTDEMQEKAGGHCRAGNGVEERAALRMSKMSVQSADLARHLSRIVHI
ncbi:hypothetical protein K466DRAFT_403041 [Polyporus arcularius HHB13444]|uniref:Uncharacterized protein n=1 Tax=Polyporus arcularius HHB13444 TaxID=1314778 RepID=A0A5C3NRD3_9APHY|nr:hypothetical protein K466DRAFT_403041 [Polyporus arcularius HHB13444]